MTSELRSRCRAKDPSTCRVHGSQSVEDPFEAALRKVLPNFDELTQRFDQTAILREKLKAEYESSVPLITDELFPIGDIEKLEDYNREYELLLERLTEEERRALYRYTGISSERINRHLYMPGVTEDTPGRRAATLDDIRVLDGLFSKQAAREEERTLYRVMSQDLAASVKPMMSSKKYAQTLGFTQGETITLPTYLSTTLDAEDVHNRVGVQDEHFSLVLIIKSKLGVPTAYTDLVPDVSSIQGREREILLPRNMTFQVQKVQRIRVHAGDGSSVEPLAVYLDEV